MENEYGEVGLKEGLLIDAQEEVLICLTVASSGTVRGDLIRVLGKLKNRHNKFDYVLIQTTGLTD